MACRCLMKRCPSKIQSNNECLQKLTNSCNSLRLAEMIVQAFSCVFWENDPVAMAGLLSTRTMAYTITSMIYAYAYALGGNPCDPRTGRGPGTDSPGLSETSTTTRAPSAAAKGKG